MDELEMTVKFCYTCLKVYSGGSYMRLDFAIPGDVTYTKKLKFCVPEMLLDNLEESIMCKQCSISLDSAFLFRSMCLETENKLQLLRQKNEETIDDALEEVENNDLGFSVTDVRTLSDDESNDVTSLAENAADRNTPSLQVVAADTTNITPLTDQELIEKCCATMPELKNVTPESLQCWVSSSKIIPLKNNRQNADKGCKQINSRPNDELWCSICSKYIRGKHHYKTHLQRHLRGVYICTFCLFNCNTRNNLDIHKNTCPKRKQFKKVCAETTLHKLPQLKLSRSRSIVLKQRKITSNMVKVNRRLKPSLRKVNYRCLLCSFTTHRSIDLHLHNQSHVGSPPLQCKTCLRTFHGATKYIRHMITSHGELENIGNVIRPSTAYNTDIEIISPLPLKCNFCSKTFKETKKYLRHIREAKHAKKVSAVPNENVQVKNEKYACSECKVSYSVESEFAEHMEKVHQYMDILNTCKNLDDSSELIQPHSEYYCNICKTKFARVEYFFNHACIIAETDNVIYSCHVCEKSVLGGRISLIAHVNNHIPTN